MAVKTLFYGLAPERWQQAVGSGDRALLARLERRWFGDKEISDGEREPDLRLLEGLIVTGTLYDELDDETALRLDKMIILLVVQELGGELCPIAPMRDDVQLLIRAVRNAGGSAELADVLDHMANGRRFGSSDRPIDVPNYGHLSAVELGRVQAGIGEFLAQREPKGFFARLMGGQRIDPDQARLLHDIHDTAASVRAAGRDLFCVNRDPDARWDVA